MRSGKRSEGGPGEEWLAGGGAGGAGGGQELGLRRVSRGEEGAGGWGEGHMLRTGDVVGGEGGGVTL